MMKNMNASQRWQSFFIILNCVTSDEVRHPLGFLKDEKHLNVALSRAEDGLIIMNSKKIT